jgi:hypothetical protein
MTYKKLKRESRNQKQKSKLNSQIVEWLNRIAESETTLHPGLFFLWIG